MILTPAPMSRAGPLSQPPRSVQQFWQCRDRENRSRSRFHQRNGCDTQIVQALVTAGTGFLLAVLWFDLMFDVQVIPHRSTEVPEQVVLSIATYYRRVTIDAGRMSRLVALFMLLTVVGIIAEIIRSDGAAAARWLSLTLAIVPIGVAATRTVPRAVRLGRQHDPVSWQRAATRLIYREHVLCLSSIAALLAVQLAWMR